MKSAIFAALAFVAIALAQGGPICGNTGPQADGTSNVCIVPGVPDPDIFIDGVNFAQCCNPDDCYHPPGLKVTIPDGQSVPVPNAWGVRQISIAITF